MNYGKAIKELRTRLNENQEYFAFNIGIKQSTLSNIETGVRNPSVAVLDKIAEYTNTPLSVIIWNATTIEDVAENKKEAYLLLKDSIDSFYFIILTNLKQQKL